MFNSSQVRGGINSNGTLLSGGRERRGILILQAVRQELVHLGDAGGDAEVDGLVADLDDESTDDVRVDLVGDRELLAGADVGRLGDGGLEPREGLGVEVLGREVSVAGAMRVAGGKRDLT